MKRLVSILLCLLIAAVVAGCSMDPLELDRNELSMTVGDTEKLSAGKATKVHWESSDDKVASVNGGTVTAKKAGTAVITASTEKGESQSCNVTVADKLITEVKINSTSARLEVGKTIQLTATYKPADASKTGLSWSSGDSNIAEVNEDGYVTGVSAGTTDIICTSENGITGSCSVNVVWAVVQTEAPATAPPTQAPTLAPSESPTGAQSAGSGDFIFADSSTRYLSTDEISLKLRGMSGSPVSNSFAQDAVNEIYARNGYVFKSAALNLYYQSKPWYNPNPSFELSALNAYEQYNIGLLNQY